MTDASASGFDPTCLFCRIVAREIEANIVWSDDDVVAFRDIAPQAPTHILVVPTRHITDATSVTESDGDVLAKLVVSAHKLAVDEKIADSGYRLVFNVGDDAGNTVSHLHLHLLGGRAMTWPPG